MDTFIREKVKKKLEEIIARELLISPAAIKEEHSLQDHLGADSLDSVNVIMQLEKKLAIELDDRVIRKFKIVGDIIDIVTKQMEFDHDNRR